MNHHTLQIIERLIRSEEQLPRKKLHEVKGLRKTVNVLELRCSQTLYYQYECNTVYWSEPQCKLIIYFPLHPISVNPNTYLCVLYKKLCYTEVHEYKFLVPWNVPFIASEFLLYLGGGDHLHRILIQVHAIFMTTRTLMCWIYLKF